MPSTTSARTRRNGRPLKSPLAVASSRICPGAPAAGAEETRPVPAIALSEREATINAYVSPARHLDGWMGKQGTGSDFTTIDTALLNRYFREYYRQHGALAWHGPRAAGRRPTALLPPRPPLVRREVSAAWPVQPPAVEVVHGAGTEKRAGDAGVGDGERHRQVGHRQPGFLGQRD
jgi:hypothetical protein